MTRTSTFDFEYDPSVADFAVSKRAYLDAHSDVSYHYIATSALVIDTRYVSIPRVLLLQRAASDSKPNLWEPPGGACDDEDASILNGAARELLEEAGLRATRITELVGDPHFFTTRSGKLVCRFYFAALVDISDENTPVVKLNPKEHQQFVWATLDEVKAKQVGDIALQFTRDEVHQTVLRALQSTNN
ncbi:NUDIX-domain-containing protein [Pseudovirgaria hyperparasitica]|uniref:NUDIX-domain-containing protein n=1 Tax=Pseudovirgaria hyperparasitica TaxID=470096 RepID=A0A6A6WJG9_9PEZI|nr:NUDIX-domain-containing protein [Pseudovirgaria hyperparasitica]KAF2761481.1 NUDIX-domain-containing protein [Pseudovirgaria hyperparasitica]